MRARLLTTVGDIYCRLGLYDEAGPVLDEAVEISSGGTPSEAADARLHRANLALSRFELDVAEEQIASVPGPEEGARLEHAVAAVDVAASLYDDDHARLLEARVALDNVSGNATTIDHPLTNSNTSAIVHVTKNFSPPGGLGPYNSEAFGVYFNASADKWAIFNEDLATPPEGASFNVTVFDEIFADGFESGDTSAWSVTVQ